MALNNYEILRYRYPIGIPITGIVVGRTDRYKAKGECNGYLVIELNDGFRGMLFYYHLIDNYATLTPNLIPKIGETIQVVVSHCDAQILRLSAKTSDLKPDIVESWQQFYDYLDTLTEGEKIVGTVKKIRPYGIFVDLNSPYVGLIDIGHTKFNQGKKLPLNQDDWPSVGEQITCVFAYVRFRNKQIGLGWSPD